MREAIDFVSVAGQEHQNHYEAYDSLGRLLRRTGLLRTRAERDTLAAGDTLVLHLQVQYPEYPHLRVILGEYDDQFVLPDSAPQRVVTSHGSTAIVRFAANRLGPNVLRGCAENFGSGPRTTDGKATEKGQRMYFAYPYFVR